MGNNKDKILANIHSGANLEKNGNSVKKSKEVRLSKKDLERQVDDNNMSDDEYNAAKAFYDIACPILKIDQSKHPFNKRNPIDTDTTESKMASNITEALNNDLPTKDDFNNRNIAIMMLNKKIVFACEVFDSLTELNTTGLASMLRSLNHISRYNNKKSKDYSYDIISRGNNKKNFEMLEKCFKDSCKSYKAKPLADDVPNGVKKELVNAFIGLMNRTLSFSKASCPKVTDGKNEIDTNDIKLNIPLFNIPKDVQDKDIANITKKATDQSGIRDKISNWVQQLAQSAFNMARNKISMHESIERINESLDPLQAYEIGCIDTNSISIDYTDEYSVKAAKAELKPLVDNLERSFQSQHQKQQDYKDYNNIIYIERSIKKPEDVKKLLDNGSCNGISVETVFNTLSRRMYISSNYKTSLTDWDEKTNGLLSEQSEFFSNFRNTDSLEREYDKDDLDDFQQNMSEINTQLEIFKNKAASMPDYKNPSDKEKWIDNNQDLIPFMTPQQLMQTKYAKPMGIKGNDNPTKQVGLEKQRQDTNQYSNIQAKNNKVALRNVNNITINNTKQNTNINNNASLNEDSISSVAKQLQEYLR